MRLTGRMGHMRRIGPLCPIGPINRSKLQSTRIIYIQRFARAKDRDDDAQAHCRFGGRDRHHDEDEQLTGNIPEKARESYERQIYGVEH